MADKKESKIVDVFNGEFVEAWKDGEWLYIAFPWCTINVPLENVEDLLRDLSRLIVAAQEIHAS